MINFFTEEIDFVLDQTLPYSSWLENVCIAENKTIEVINYIFCSDEYLLKINQEHLQHDFYTDVISFPFAKDPIEGDIFISIERVKENALTHKVDFFTELKRVMVHGILHFLGYDDKDEQDQKVMSNKEDFYLNQFN